MRLPVCNTVFESLFENRSFYTIDWIQSCELNVSYIYQIKINANDIFVVHLGWFKMIGIYNLTSVKVTKVIQITRVIVESKLAKVIGGVKSYEGSGVWKLPESWELLQKQELLNVSNYRRFRSLYYHCAKF